MEDAMCESLNLPTNSTETPAPSTFADKVIPFYRGEVCTVTESAAGEAFPVFVNTCVHPCMDVSRFEFKHSWTCTGSTCEAYAALWLTVDSVSACPEDAFSNFDPSQCQYPNPVSFEITPVYDDGSAVQGTMALEIPFLTNTDAEAIAAAGGAQGTIESRMQQYPQDDSRVVSGNPISLLPENAPPPESCGDDGRACDCFEIGF